MPNIRSLLFGEVRIRPGPALFVRIGLGLAIPVIPFCAGVSLFDEPEEDVSNELFPWSKALWFPGTGGIPGDNKPSLVTVIADVDREPRAKRPLVFGAEATRRMNLLADFWKGRWAERVCSMGIGCIAPSVWRWFGERSRPSKLRCLSNFGFSRDLEDFALSGGGGCVSGDHNWDVEYAGVTFPLLDGGGLEENEVGFEMEPLDWVVEEVELEEHLGSVELTEEGVRTGSWFWILLVFTNSMEERMLDLLEEGLASRRRVFQEGVEGVGG